MDTRTFDLPALAKYLQRDARELEKLAAQGTLPGRRVSGHWRFNRDNINQWLEQQLGGFSDRQLANVEAGMAGSTDSQHGEPRVSQLLQEATIAVPLDARTAPAVLQRLVEAANRTWQVYKPDELLAAVRAREALCPTALPGGVAIPHPRRPMPDALAESLIAFGRTTTGIPFGDPNGQLTDLFFLVLCRDDRAHLHVLARLSRMLQRDGFLDRLRACGTPGEVLATVVEVEESVLLLAR